MDNPVLNPEVTAFLDALEHPLRGLIEQLRAVILAADPGLEEGIMEWSQLRSAW